MNINSDGIVSANMNSNEEEFYKFGPNGMVSVSGNSSKLASQTRIKTS